MSKKDVSTLDIKTIELALLDEDWRVRQAAMNACVGRDVPLDIIERWLKDENWRVRQAAMNACVGMDVPMDIIKRGLKDGHWCVRQAAMKACVGRDVPMDIIERWMKDDGYTVLLAAMNACKKNGIQVPIIRTIEPPALVYKKCLADVIVVAEIPKDAQVRGDYNRKCRSDKAIIKDIIGDFFGEKVGISSYDKTTCYRVGDVVEIDDFDMSNEECSTGFHFFCDRKLAEDY